MKGTARLILPLVLCFATISLGQLKKVDDRPPLQQAKVLVKETLKLKVDGDRLVLDVEWLDKQCEDEELQAIHELVPSRQNRNVHNRMKYRGAALVRAIANVGQMRGGSWGGSNTNWHLRLDSSLINTRISRTRDKSMTISLQEVTAAGRIEVGWKNNKSMTILVTQEDELLYLVQKPSGAIRILHDVNDDVVVKKASSFGELLKSEPAFVHKRFYSQLGKIGFSMPLTRDSSDVATAVLAMLEPIPDGLSDEAKKRLKELDSDDAEVRNAAVDDLTDRYPIYEKTIKLYRKNPNLSDQAKAQLQRIKFSQNHVATAREFAKRMKLDCDVNFLIGLFDQSLPSRHEHIMRKLKEVTGKDLGNDIDAWKKLLKK